MRSKEAATLIGQRHQLHQAFSPAPALQHQNLKPQPETSKLRPQNNPLYDTLSTSHLEITVFTTPSLRDPFTALQPQLRHLKIRQLRKIDGCLTLKIDNYAYGY
jgi:hypothetical protein